MERTEKKCLIASAASHGLLLGTLLIGSAFISKPPPADEVVPVLNMYNSRVVDSLINGGGGGGRTAPVPTPRVVPAPVQPQVQPTQPIVQPVKPTQPVRTQPTTKPVVEPVTPPRTTAKAPRDDSPKLPIKPDGIEKSGKSLFQPTTRSPKTNKRNKTGANDDNGAHEKAAKKASQERADAVNHIVEGLSKQLASSGGLTASDMPGIGSGPAAINYLQTVLGAYDAAWDPPREIEADDSIVTVRVKVARSGNILSAVISKRSGIPALDQSVQRALERVRSLNPFPEGSKDLERNFKIEFNLKAKRARA